jgi:hypothetical protein
LLLYLRLLSSIKSLYTYFLFYMPFSCYWPFKFIILYFLNLKFEKISPLIDELDTLLISTYIQNINRTQILASVIISSLTSQNPVKFIKDQINFYRSFIGIKKASGFVALTQNIPLEQAQLLLKSIILAAPYSKNKFNK